MNPNFIAGLVAGEGSFVELKRKSPNVTFREFSFQLRMAQDEELLVNAVRDCFMAGHISHRDSSHANWQPAVEYRISRQRDLKDIIIPFFDEYLADTPSKKAQQYLKWRAAFFTYYNNRHVVGWKSPEGKARLITSNKNRIGTIRQRFPKRARGNCLFCGLRLELRKDGTLVKHCLEGRHCDDYPGKPHRYCEGEGKLPQEGNIL